MRPSPIPQRCTPFFDSLRKRRPLGENIHCINVDFRDTVNKNYWTWFWHYKFGNCYIFNPKVIRGVQRKGLKAFRSGISHGQ